MMALRLARSLRARLLLIRPAGAASCLCELSAENVSINRLNGWRGAAVEWIFLRGGVDGRAEYGTLLQLASKEGAARTWSTLKVLARKFRRAHKRMNVHLLRLLMLRKGDGSGAKAPTGGNAAGALGKKTPKRASIYVSPYYKRLWLDQAPTLSFPLERSRELQSELEREYGLGPAPRLVVFHAGSCPQRQPHLSEAGYRAAIGYLGERGFSVACVGDRDANGPAHEGAIDVRASPRSEMLQLFCAARAEFVLATALDGAALAWAFGKPVLVLAAADPIASFPIRERDLFTLCHVRARGGRRLSVDEMLTDDYLDSFDDARRYEILESSSEETVAAVQDMVDATEKSVPPELPEQRDFRLRVTRIAMERSLGRKAASRHGPHHSYLGRGRLAPSFARKLLTPLRSADE
jgi:putative glycosyltransferase (TIGR04372 family)